MGDKAVILYLVGYTLLFMFLHGYTLIKEEYNLEFLAAVFLLNWYLLAMFIIYKINTIGLLNKFSLAYRPITIMLSIIILILIKANESKIKVYSTVNSFKGILGATFIVFSFSLAYFYPPKTLELCLDHLSTATTQTNERTQLNGRQLVVDPILKEKNKMPRIVSTEPSLKKIMNTLKSQFGDNDRPEIQFTIKQNSVFINNDSFRYTPQSARTRLVKEISKWRYENAINCSVDIKLKLDIANLNDIDSIVVTINGKIYSRYNVNDFIVWD